MALFFKIKELCNIALTRNSRTHQRLQLITGEEMALFRKKRFFTGFWRLFQEPLPGKMIPDGYSIPFYRQVG